MKTNLFVLILSLTASTIRCDCNSATTFTENFDTGEWDFQIENAIECTNISLNARNPLKSILKEKPEESIIIIKNSTVPVLESSIFDSYHNLQKITFENVSLVDIQPHAFADLANLTSIKLNNNKLTKIRNFAFSGVPNLLSLTLQNNNLTSLDQINQISTLKHLDLRDNQIRNISEKDFEKLRSLENLYLSGNLITSINSSIITQLSNLDVLLLQNNSLTSFSMPYGHLGTLRLDANFLQTIEIENLTNIAFLFLSDNNFKNIKKGQFKTLTKLQHLFLSRNFITDIDVDGFENLNSLVMLELNENELSTLYIGTFRNLNSLEYLYLSGNKLESFEEGTFTGLDNLETLDLSSNRIQILNYRAFYSLRSLASIRLHGNFLENFNVKEFKTHFERLNSVSLEFKQVGCNNLADISRILRERIDVIQHGQHFSTHNIRGIKCDPDIKKIDSENEFEQILRIISYFSAAKVMYIFVVIFALLMLAMRITTVYDLNVVSYCRTIFSRRQNEKLVENGTE